MTVPTSDESVRRSGADGDDGGGLFDAADFERDVDARALIDLEDDAVAHPLLEARRR